MKCMKWRKYYPYSRFYEYGKGSEAMKKTKIVCTIGPASETEEVLRELIDNGLNIARIDFSCEDQENHKENRYYKKDKGRSGLPNRDNVGYKGCR